MTELSPEARRLLGQARRGADPTESDRIRVGRRLMKRLGIATGIGGSTLGAAKVASGATVWSLWSVKNLLLGAAVLTLGGGVAALRLAESGNLDIAESRPALAMATTPPVAMALQAAIASAESAAADALPAPEAAADATAVAPPAAPARATAASRSAPTAERVGAKESAASSLANEVAALRQAQRLLRSGQAQAALGLIESQDGRFARGALVQERAAVRIFALCSLGRRAEARKLSQAFERRWPRSPTSARVRRACEPQADR